MQLIVTAVKVFRLNPNEVLEMGYAKLMWMFKEYNEMFDGKKKEKKEDGFSSFKGMRGVNFTRV